jgi:hypothetical protein
MKNEAETTDRDDGASTDADEAAAASLIARPSSGARRDIARGCF